MANLQSLLLPVSALGNQSSVRLSTPRGALDAQGNGSEAPDAVDDGVFNGERSFSRLLIDNADFDPAEAKKAKVLPRGEANLSSSSVSDAEIARLGPLSGKKLPVGGQVLPPFWASGFDDLFSGEFKATAQPIGQMVIDKEHPGEVKESALWSNFQRSVGDSNIVAPLISDVEVNIANARRLVSKDSLSALTADTLTGARLDFDKNAILSAEMGGIDLTENTLKDGKLLPLENLGLQTAGDLAELVDPAFAASGSASLFSATKLEGLGLFDFPANTLTVEQPLPLLNSGSQIAGDLLSLKDSKLPAPHLSSMVSESESNAPNMAQTEPSLLAGGSGDTQIESADSQVLPEVQGRLALQDSLDEIEISTPDALLSESREVQFAQNQPQITDASVQSSQPSNSSAGPAMSLLGGISSQEATQGRSRGVDFINSLDFPGKAEDSAAEFSRSEGLTLAPSQKSGDKALPLAVSSSLALAASFADASAVQNHSVTNGTSLTNALSQWRVDQDNTNVANADSLERQGFSKLSVPFNQSGWGENLGKQLSLLLAKNMDSAQIQLDPPELGPLTVKIQINQGQISLQFTSGHYAVREALEQSSQRLQQMFSDEGLDLIDVGVSDQKSDSNQDDEQAEAKPKFDESSVGLIGEGDGLLTAVRIMAIDDGNIDYFV